MSDGEDVLRFCKLYHLMFCLSSNFFSQTQASYVWLLLVFSYMMLFKFDPPNRVQHKFHWTEIYTLVTISVMLVEDVRRVRI